MKSPTGPPPTMITSVSNAAILIYSGCCVTGHTPKLNQARRGCPRLHALLAI